MSAIAIAAPTLSKLESRILAFIVERDGASEDEILAQFWPAPKWPDGAAVGSPEAAQWFDLHVTWKAKAYGGIFHRNDGSEEPVTPYGQTYSAQRSQACIRLGKLGLIREHNNGFCCYHYTVNKSGRDWLRAFGLKGGAS